MTVGPVLRDINVTLSPNMTTKHQGRSSSGTDREVPISLASPRGPFKSWRKVVGPLDVELFSQVEALLLRCKRGYFNKYSALLGASHGFRGGYI